MKCASFAVFPDEEKGQEILASSTRVGDDEKTRGGEIGCPYGGSHKCPLSMSAKFLYCIGGQSHMNPCGKIEVLLGRVIRWLLIVLFLSVALTHAFFLPSGTRSQGCSSIIMISANLIACAMITIGNCSGRAIGTTLKAMMKYTSPGEIDLVRRNDKKMSLTNFALVLIQLGLFFLYIHHFGLRETQALMIGKVLYADHSAAAYILTIIATVTYELVCMAMLASVQYYVSVQYVCFVFAKNCLKHFKEIALKDERPLGSVKINQMRKRIELYNSAQSCINENIGFMPFGILAFVWIVVTVGISSLVMKDAIFSPLFGLITIGFTIFKVCCHVYWITVTAGQSTKAMTQARIIAGKIITETTGQKEVCKEALTLAHYLAIDPLVHYYAWDMFEISPCLALGFCNAVIPFTIMIITTNREFSN